MRYFNSTFNLINLISILNFYDFAQELVIESILVIFILRNVKCDLLGLFFYLVQIFDQ
jgi:hypothetical protein